MNSRFVEIRKWLLDRGIKQIEIARQAKVSRTTVNQFCKGFTTSRRLSQIFEDLGCPQEILDRKVA